LLELLLYLLEKEKKKEEKKHAESIFLAVWALALKLILPRLKGPQKLWENLTRISGK